MCNYAFNNYSGKMLTQNVKKDVALTTRHYK